MMLVCHEQRWIMCRPPRTGGTMFDEFLRSDKYPYHVDRINADRLDMPERGIQHGYKIPDSISDNYLRWALVRNPYERAASIYRILTAEGTHRFGFAHFVNWLTYDSLYAAEKHTGYKAIWRFTIQEMLSVFRPTKLVRIENYVHEFNALYIGSIKPLPYVNASPHMSVDWTPELVEQIRTYYHGDFQYGYDPDEAPRC